MEESIDRPRVEHQRGLKDGAEWTKETIRTLRSWCTAFELTIEDLVAQGDQVWIRATGRGLDTGSIFGRPGPAAVAG